MDYAQGGMQVLLMLKKDGTVDILDGYKLNNGINVEQLKGLKNVVNVLPLNMGHSISYRFITITGKVIDREW